MQVQQVRFTGKGMVLYSGFNCFQFTKSQAAQMNWGQEGVCYVRFEAPGNFWFSLIPFAENCQSWPCCFRTETDGYLRISDTPNTGKPMRNFLLQQIELSVAENLAYPELLDMGNNVWFASYDQAVRLRRRQTSPKSKATKVSGEPETPLQVFIRCCITQEPSLEFLTSGLSNPQLLKVLQAKLQDLFGESHSLEHLERQCRQLFKGSKAKAKETAQVSQTITIERPSNQEYHSLKERVLRLEEELATIEDRVSQQMENYYRASLEKAEQIVQTNARIFA